MACVTDRAGFWTHVQMDLVPLPRPWKVLPHLKRIDLDLFLSLVNGELWLLRPERTVEELEDGWEWWLSLYRQAVALVERKGKRATA